MHNPQIQRQKPLFFGLANACYTSAMQLLLKVRLSVFFFFLLAFYLCISFSIHSRTLSPAALTLFSVNSFLYGFYISPVLGSQKQRIEDLSRIIRAESNALFDMLIKTKKLPRHSRNTLQAKFTAYVQACVAQRRPAEGEDEYEQLISYCLEYDGEEPEIVEKILGGLVANQANRSQLAMQLGNNVFNNEWWIILVLFSITDGFVLFLSVQNSPLLNFVKALLCTGLTMLLLNLLKLSTLTHKKARHIWDPLEKLQTSRFRRTD